MSIPLVLLAVHFVADFLLQTDWMALNKSKNWLALAVHAGVYALCFTPWGYPFFLITFATHFLTDAITSRITSRLWFISLIPLTEEERNRNTWTSTFRGTVEPGKRHWFFVVIGADQLIHYVTLALTYKYLFG